MCGCMCARVKNKANKRKLYGKGNHRGGVEQFNRRRTVLYETEQINIGWSAWNSLSVNIIRRHIRMGVASLIDRHTCPIFRLARASDWARRISISIHYDWIGAESGRGIHSIASMWFRAMIRSARYQQRLTSCFYRYHQFIALSYSPDWMDSFIKSISYTHSIWTVFFSSKISTMKGHLNHMTTWTNTLSFCK